MAVTNLSVRNSWTHRTYFSSISKSPVLGLAIHALSMLNLRSACLVTLDMGMTSPKDSRFSGVLV